MSLNQSKYYNFTKDSQTGNLKILDESHYYPFGLKHQEYSTFGFVSNPIQGVIIAPLTNNPYKYKYNGKEWQDELNLNMYDMDMRQYDPAIARWVVMDPVIHHSVSPYSAFDNNPVFWADPSGAAPEIGSVFEQSGMKVGSLTIQGTGTSIGAGGAQEDNGGLSESEVEAGYLSSQIPNISNDPIDSDGSIIENNIFEDNTLPERFDGEKITPKGNNFNKEGSSENCCANLWKFFTDNVVSPPLESFQIASEIIIVAVGGTIYKIIEGTADEGGNIGGDTFYVMKFENGIPVLKHYKPREMSFDQKKNAFLFPIISTGLSPIKFFDNPLLNFSTQIGVGEAINRVIIDNIKEN